ncbi:RusA family crossover junction endodeoxyribonuclease [Chitinimonas lacunae]|uniref:RusA family crossover junction endodeoxyribonuclease n=1 Tax=Chitinimonas lacunae TaxID=1963018 RepID=A0ABV8MUN8_9NEIS
MTQIRFVIPGAPQGKGRPRASARRVGAKTVVRMYTPEKTVSYEGQIAAAAAQAMAGRQLLEGPVLLSLDICFPVPASWSKRKQAQALAGELAPTKKPDIDNVAKAIADGVNGIVWVDDVQVCEIHARKRYGQTPGVIVVIERAAAAA